MMHWHGPGGLHGADYEEALGRVYDHQVVTRLTGHLRKYWALTLVSVVAMLLYTLTGVAIPWVIKEGIDTFVRRGDLAGLNRVAILFAVIMVVNFITSYVQLAAMAKVSQGVLFDLRTQMFSHLQRLSLSFYDRNEVGRIMSRVQNDVQQLQEFLSIVVLSLGDALSLVGIVVAMLIMDPPLALITLAVVPLLFGLMVVWQRQARLSFMRVRRAIAAVNAGLQENLSGVRVVQSMGREDVNLRRFDRVNYDHLDANLQATRLSSTLLPAVELITAGALGLVVVFGGSMVLQGTLAVGALVAFALYIQRFFDPIRNLTMQYTELQRAMTSGTRIFQLLDIQPEVQDHPGAKDLPEIKGEIRFEDVGFQYTPDVRVLQDINLHIRPGEMVALVGPTGAGKTTLVSLVARFYDVTHGRIAVDGYDLREVTRTSLARQMGVVLQEPFLFSGTIRENIRYCHRDATDEKIMEAAMAVGAHDFIMRLENGYDTQLQERGVNLSMGQRQLISFARALAANPRILILDEATANIDSLTEMLIQRALGRLLEGRTSLVIAHRLSTVRSAHRIVVLDQGRIVEEGTHEALIVRGGLYARLYALNYADQA